MEDFGFVKVKRALVSVTDKSNLRKFALELWGFGIDIVSTGGSAKEIGLSSIPVIEVATVTQFPEMMGGRLKTIHPLIAGGILMRPDNPDDVQAAEQHDIVPIQLVVVNLYDFAGVAQTADATMEQLINHIDIGGPTMIRAAAKNWQNVAVVTSPEQYPAVIQDLTENNGQLSPELRCRFMQEAFELTASYDTHIALAMNMRMPDGSLNPDRVPREREV